MSGLRWGLLWLSETDPWWVIAGQLVGWGTGAILTAWWVVAMARRAPAPAAWVPWRLGWYWALVGRLAAAAIVFAVQVCRVATIGHLRAGDAIGEAVRLAEVLSLVHFAAWAALAFWRWWRPAGGDEGAT